MTPTIVASENGRKGAAEAMKLLRQGGSALDAVEIASRIVEDDPEEHSVGYSGLPNLLGDVELDASIMDGRTLDTGAVSCLRGYGNAITLARHVMEKLPHVLITAEGAERFAAELGLPQADQRSVEALDIWRKRLAEHNINLAETAELAPLTHQLSRPLNLSDQPPPEEKDNTLGTVNFLALDQDGNLASAVTTSGLAWKYPGRVGDSPIIGAGNYCDNRYGAAACTGMGELAIRVSTARSLILYLKMGMNLQKAGLETLRDLEIVAGHPSQYMNIVSLTPQGEHSGFTTVEGKSYLYMTAEMEEPELTKRTCL